jgi:hypothetical protein
MGLDVAVEVVDGGNEEIEGEVLESKRRASSLSLRRCAAELGVPVGCVYRRRGHGGAWELEGGEGSGSNLESSDGGEGRRWPEIPATARVSGVEGDR